jgi:prophage regulatory protein
MIETNQSRPLFIRRTQLREIAGISPSTAWRLEKAGKFPQRRQIGGSPSCVGWLYEEVSEYLKSCEKVV